MDSFTQTAAVGRSIVSTALKTKQGWHSQLCGYAPRAEIEKRLASYRESYPTCEVVELPSGEFMLGIPATAPAVQSNVTPIKTAANDGAAAVDNDQAITKHARRKRAKTECLADVKETERVDLYPHILTRGKHTTIGGDPGLGKSVLWANLAARLSVGGKVSPYSEAEFKPATVLYCSAEDGTSDDIKPRLRVAGADMRRAHSFLGVMGAEGLEHLNLGSHLDALDEILGDLKVDFFLVDPVSSFLGKIDSHQGSQIRSTIDPLKMLMEKHQCAFGSIQHLNKNERGSAIYRMSGSVALIGAPRVAFMFIEDKSTGRKGDRLLLPVKRNLGAYEPGYRLSIVDKDGHAFAQWGERSNVDANDLMGAQPPSKGQQAEELLREILLPGLEVAASDIERVCRERGIGNDTRRNALHAIGAEAKRIGAEGTKNGHWVWFIRESAVKHGTDAEWDAVGAEELGEKARAPLDAAADKINGGWLET